MTFTEYNKCVDMYADHIYRFILKNIRNVEISKDIVQETFVKIWERVETVEFGKAKSYIFMTAYHTMIDHIRIEKRYSSIEDLNFEFSRQDTKLNIGVKELLNETIDRLPAIQKSVILLRDYEGYSYNEIAEITGLTLDQVKTYIFRARVTLKKIIGKIDNVI